MNNPELIEPYAGPVDEHPAVKAAQAVLDPIRARLLEMVEEEKELNRRYAAVVGHEADEMDEPAREVQRLLDRVSRPLPQHEVLALRTALQRVKADISVLRFAEGKAYNAVRNAINGSAVASRLHCVDFVRAAKRVHQAAQVLADEVAAAQALAASAVADGYGCPSAYYWLSPGSHASASAVEAWRVTAERMCGARLQG